VTTNFLLRPDLYRSGRIWLLHLTAAIEKHHHTVCGVMVLVADAGDSIIQFLGPAY
jgi:hypothetical protein